MGTNYTNIITMHNSQKGILLTRKQFNTQNTSTPTKKPNQSYNDSSLLSQNKTNYENSAVGSGVSYSQLQIILENVQQVKKKASQQIQTLEKKNNNLEEELKAAKQQVKRYENLQETIKEQKNSVQKKYQVEIHNLKQNVAEMQNTCSILSDEISSLTSHLDTKKQELLKQKDQTQKYKKQLTQSEARYRRLTDLLKITQDSNQIRIIREQYQDIPSMLATVIKMNTSIQHYVEKLEETKIVCQQLRDQIMQSNKVIGTVTEENRHLLGVINELSQQKDNLSANLKRIESEKHSALIQKDHTLLQIQDQILNIRKSSDQQLTQRETVITNLHQQIRHLKHCLSQYEQRQKAWKQENQFKVMVDQVCNQYTDYDNVLRRIEYLEKYRSQYYFNIEKIQYLCKILDS